MPMTAAEELRVEYAERLAERYKIRLIDIRDKLAAPHDPHTIIEEINDFLAEVILPGEGKVDKCPDCGEPWWTVQKRCKCWPKPQTGKVEQEVSNE